MFVVFIHILPLNIHVYSFTTWKSGDTNNCCQFKRKADSSSLLQNTWLLMVKKCLLFSDIDECSVNPLSCDSVNGMCMNSDGSYICSCNSGYEVGDDDIICYGKVVMSN